MVNTMGFSSYQIERVIERLRRWRGWITEARYVFPLVPDRLRVSGEGAEKAKSADPRPRAPNLPSVAKVVEGEGYPPRVEEERERRAGSFLNPPNRGSPLPLIPKLQRSEEEEAPREDAKMIGEGD